MAGRLRKSEWPRFFLAASVGAALAVLPNAGCDLERCEVESRSLEYAAESRVDSQTGTGALQLSETRGAENANWVIWHVRVAPFAGMATAVSLRQGPPEAPGRVLYEFPLVNPVSESGVITQVFVRNAYAGEVPFAELWELIQHQPVSFEVVFEGDVPALRIGPLLRTGFSDWQEVCS